MSLLSERAAWKGAEQGVGPQEPLEKYLDRAQPKKIGGNFGGNKIGEKFNILEYQLII